MTDRRLTVAIGWTIAIIWLVASVSAFVSGRGLPPEQQPALKHYALGWHTYAEGPFVVRLFAYSFNQGSVFNLILNLWILANAVGMARDHVSPAAMVRLYSLGSVATGLVYLFVSSWIGNTLPLVGGGGVLMTLFAVMAVLNPSQRVMTIVMKEISLPWFVGWIFLIQLLALKSSPHLSLGMIAGLVAGVLYGFVERLVARNVR